MVLTSPRGDALQRSIKCGIPATNNEAGYEALIVRLDLAASMGIQYLTITIDSQLVANQINGTYQTKDVQMLTYLQLAQQKLTKFKEATI